MVCIVAAFYTFLGGNNVDFKIDSLVIDLPLSGAKVEDCFDQIT